jgi:hypothetical protein
MDVLRTLAHEMVHHKQDINGELNDRSGEDGSPQENEANAKAAVIMSLWAKMNPELFQRASILAESWSAKYKSSINCSNPKGFSQKAHCAGKAKNENFADGKNPQDKGDSKRHGVPTKASVSTLRKVAKQGGRKGQLAHWMANMKAGRKK